MNPVSTEDVLDLLDSGFAAAAAGAAMELGLFWLLEEKPLSPEGVAQALGIPKNRCQYWLQILSRSGLIENGPDGYAPSETARSTILDAYSQASWALLAQEARETSPAVLDLALRMPTSRSTTEAQEPISPGYIEQMSEDPDRARRFTRMLYEIHEPLAKALTQVLDMSGVNRLMDLGGSSGVVSVALLRRHPHLSAVVVDIPTVCAAGREIAEEKAMVDRIGYHACNFLDDPLPSGFDMVLECDVNVYGEELFHKIRDSLNPGGRLVIADYFAPSEGVAPQSRAHWALRHSMTDPDFLYPTASHVRNLLAETGFRLRSESILAPDIAGATRFTGKMTLIEARR